MATNIAQRSRSQGERTPRLRAITGTRHMHTATATHPSPSLSAPLQALLGTHALAPPALVCPKEQPKHTDAPAPLYCPGGHAIHGVVPSLAVPARHGTQVVSGPQCHAAASARTRESSQKSGEGDMHRMQAHHTNAILISVHSTQTTPHNASLQQQPLTACSSRRSRAAGCTRPRPHTGCAGAGAVRACLTRWARSAGGGAPSTKRTRQTHLARCRGPTAHHTSAGSAGRAFRGARGRSGPWGRLPHRAHCAHTGTGTIAVLAHRTRHTHACHRKGPSQAGHAGPGPHDADLTRRARGAGSVTRGAEGACSTRTGARGHPQARGGAVQTSGTGGAGCALCGLTRLGAPCARGTQGTRSSHCRLPGGCTEATKWAQAGTSQLQCCLPCDGGCTKPAYRAGRCQGRGGAVVAAGARRAGGGGRASGSHHAARAWHASSAACARRTVHPAWQGCGAQGTDVPKAVGTSTAQQLGAKKQGGRESARAQHDYSLKLTDCARDRDPSHRTHRQCRQSIDVRCKGTRQLCWLRQFL